MTSFIGLKSYRGNIKLKPAKAPLPAGYDIFIISGQSNTYYGRSSVATVPDGILDASEARIYQLGRYGGNNNLAVLASEQLDHYLDPPTNMVGFALTFAKIYKQNLLASNRDVLLVPCGRSSAGFANNWFNSGNPLDLDVKARTATALALGSGTNILRGVLWHQGETDALESTAFANAHKGNMLALIDRWRTHFGTPNLPFLVGGMVPAWVSGVTDHETVQNGLIDIPNQRSFTGYANPAYPTELTADTSIDTIHFSAESTRGGVSRDISNIATCGLAGRYWTAYLEALSNS